jgi:hypothetical protein
VSEFTDSLKGLPPQVAAQFSELHDGAMVGKINATANVGDAPKTNMDSATQGAGTLSIQPGAALGIPGRFDTGLPVPQGLNRTLIGAGQGLANVARHVGNMVGMVPSSDIQESNKYDSPILNTPTGQLGSFIGGMAGSAPLGMGVGAGLGKLAPFLGRFATNPISQGVIQGTTQGAVLGDPGQKGQDALLGGALGGALPVAGQTIGKIANGLSRTPQAQSLINRGISLTPGQMNPTGVANRMEQALEGMPGVGDMVQNAREGGQKQYVAAMVNDAMAPGARLSGKANDFNGMINEAAASFDPAYDAGKGFPIKPVIMNATGPQVSLSQAFQSVANAPRLGLDADIRASLGKQLTDQLKEMTQAAVKSGKGIQSDDLLGLRSIIRQASRDENGTTAASRATRAFWNDAGDKVTQVLNSQLPPQVTQGLQAADAQYAKFAIMRDVAKAVKDTPGGPSPYQISNAIANATDTNTYARGGGLNRDIAKAARDTFQSNVPRTGLAGMGRLALPAIAGYLGAPALMAHPAVAAAVGAPLVGMAGLTLTKAGRNLASGNTGLQKALQGGLMNLQQTPEALQSLLPLYSRMGMGLLGPTRED